MGLKDFLFGRRKQALNEKKAKALYTGMLIDHGYTPQTARAEANKRIKTVKKNIKRDKKKL